MAAVNDPPSTGALRQRRIAELERHVLHRQPEQLGGDLGHDRVGAGADVGGCAATVSLPSAVSTAVAPPVSCSASQTPLAMPQPISSIALAHRPRLRVAPRPAELLRALAVAFAQLLARERLVLVLVRARRSSSAAARPGRCRARRRARPSRIRARTRPSAAPGARMSHGVGRSSWTTL